MTAPPSPGPPPFSPGPHAWTTVHGKVTAADFVAGNKIVHLGVAPRAPHPAQLPTDTGNFTGRDAAMAELDALLRSTGDGTRALVITSIQGMPGVGKTALAVHWAHRVADRFPGGQLYLDLRGHSPDLALTAAEALGHLLRALGVDGALIPTDPAEAAGLYRTLLADRAVLVVLDNASDSEQVRPLLPAGPSCLVVVTSRNRLTGLVAHDGAHPVNLDVLTPDEALDLVNRILGERRVAAERAAAVDLARRCAYLPLAIGIAAADLAARPHDPIASAAAELAAGQRLSALMLEGDPRTAVRVAFDFSYHGGRLGDAERRAFRLLGMIEGRDFTLPAAAALLGLPQPHARRLLRALHRANLVDADGDDRYRLHDLLREYARERAEAEESEADREHAALALVRWYLGTARTAGRLLNPHRVPLVRAGAPVAEAPEGGFPDVGFPGGDDYARSLAWFEAERDNLVALVPEVERLGADRLGWELADALYDFLELRSYSADNIEVHHRGLAAARRRGDQTALGYMLQHLALIHVEVGDYERAYGHAEAAREHFRAAGHRHGEGAAVAAISRIDRMLGSYAESLAAAAEALAIREEIGDRRGQGETLDHVGCVHLRSGAFREARRHLAEALAIREEIGDRRGQGETLDHLATAYRSVGRYAEALDRAQRSLRIRAELGDRHGQAEALSTIASTYRELGRYPEARDHARRSLAIRREIRDRPCQAAALVNLARTARRLGRYDEALDHAREALEIRRDIGDRHGEGETLAVIGTLYFELGAYPRALSEYAASREIRRDIGDRYGEAELLAEICLVRLRRSEFADALAAGTESLRIRREIGDRRGQAETLDFLSRGYRRIDRLDEALADGRRALRIRREIGDARGEAESCGGIARVHRRAGRYRCALRFSRRAVRIWTAIGDPRGLAAALDGMARTHRRLGRRPAALEHAERALGLCRSIGDRFGESLALDNLARIALAGGEAGVAVEYATQAVAIEREIGNRYGQGQTLGVLGAAYAVLGRTEPARASYREGAEVCREIGDAATERHCRERLAAIDAADVAEEA